MNKQIGSSSAQTLKKRLNKTIHTKVGSKWRSIGNKNTGFRFRFGTIVNVEVLLHDPASSAISDTPDLFLFILRFYYQEIRSVIEFK